MSYLYSAGSHRLTHVDDAVAANVATNDFDDMATGQNFRYDVSGHLVSDPQQAMTMLWYSFDKLYQVSKNASVTSMYGYDATPSRALRSLPPKGDSMTNRVKKEEIANGVSVKKTFYVRDAQGNALATYEFAANQLTWKEQNLYGSERLGMALTDVVVYNAPSPAAQNGSQTTPYLGYMHYNGAKRYEITNHLGNVLATITDRRIAAVGSQDWQTALYFRSEPVQVSDYEPFGSELTNRTWTRTGGGTEYRFGFQSQEIDSEIFGGKTAVA